MAGVVAEAELRKDLERPRGPRSQRKGGRPIAGRSGGTDCFKHRKSLLDIPTKLARGLFPRRNVRPAVARYLVCVGGDSFDGARVVSRGDSEYEERRVDAELAEQRERVVHLAFELVVGLIPAGTAYRSSRELMPVLEVDRKKDSRASVRRGRRGPTDACVRRGVGGRQLDRQSFERCVAPAAG